MKIALAQTVGAFLNESYTLEPRYIPPFRLPIGGDLEDAKTTLAAGTLTFDLNFLTEKQKVHDSRPSPIGGDLDGAKTTLAAATATLDLDFFDGEGKVYQSRPSL